MKIRLVQTVSPPEYGEDADIWLGAAHLICKENKLLINLPQNHCLSVTSYLLQFPLSDNQKATSHPEEKREAHSNITLWKSHPSVWTSGWHFEFSHYAQIPVRIPWWKIQLGLCWCLGNCRDPPLVESYSFFFFGCSVPLYAFCRSTGLTKAKGRRVQIKQHAKESPISGCSEP